MYNDGSNRGLQGSALAEPLAAPRRLARRAGTRIAAIAVSDSEDVLSQDQVLERLGLAGDEFAERIFARSGVERRHLNLSEDFLGRTMQGRAKQIEHDLLSHSIRAIDTLALDPSQIATVVSSSLYSLGCPTLAHQVVDHYAMDPSTDKYHVSGVGCASAVPLMRLAAQTMHASPGRHALVVAAESMSGILTRATAEDPKAKTVGSALFGDGCAVALLSDDASADGPIILDSQVHQLSHTLDAVRLDLSAEDSYLHLARDLPDLAGRASLTSPRRSCAATNSSARTSITGWPTPAAGASSRTCRARSSSRTRTSPRAGARWPSTETSAHRRSCTCSKRRSSAVRQSRVSTGCW